MPEVRLKCVLALQALYGDAQLYSKLDLFTVRFKVNTNQQLHSPYAAEMFMML